MASTVSMCTARRLLFRRPARAGKISGSMSSFSSATITPNPAPTLSCDFAQFCRRQWDGCPLTATGSNFVNGASLQWNGIGRTTTFINNTTLTASIPASIFGHRDEHHYGFEPGLMAVLRRTRAPLRSIRPSLHPLRRRHFPFTNVTTSHIQANWGANGTAGRHDVLRHSLQRVHPRARTYFSGNTSSTTFNLNAVFSPLSLNTTYFVDVAAINSVGSTSTFQSLGSTPTLANAPTSAAFSNVQSTQVTANWGAGGNPAGTPYTVLLSTDPAFGTFSLTTTTGTLAIFSNLAPSTAYFAKVLATNYAGLQTAFTNLGSTTTTTVPVNPPLAGPFTNVNTSQLRGELASQRQPH